MCAPFGLIPSYVRHRRPLAFQITPRRNAQHRNILPNCFAAETSHFTIPQQSLSPVPQARSDRRDSQVDRLTLHAFGCARANDLIASLGITPEILALIAEIDEFKGAWRALGTLAPERLSALRRVATIESIGSSTRIEGSKLSDREVERLLANLEIKSFASRDEQEVAGYAQVMELVFRSWQDITITENHIKQLHRALLVYSTKDARHRGEYKTSSNNVAAFDKAGKQIGIVFATATPFDTPRLMTEPSRGSIKRMTTAGCTHCS